MKNRKGFTLVELLVVIVIIGIILGMSWPAISKVQENNELSNYRKYGESLVAAAKLYVDAYEEDLFYYEDDLTEDEQERGQCAYISYADLAEHQLIKDYSKNGITCNSESTFVRVVRKKDRYRYEYYLGCGYVHDDNSILTNDSGEIFYTLPTDQHLNYPDPALCSRTHTEDAPPQVTYMWIYSRTSYNGPDIRVSIEASDNDTERKNLKYCVTTDEHDCPDGWKKFGSNYSVYENYTIPDVTLDGSSKVIFVHVKDLNGNIGTSAQVYRLYKKCSSTKRKNQVTISECDKICGGGHATVKYDLYDYYFDEFCSTENNGVESCNTFSCCTKVRRTCTGGEDIDSTQCDNACVGSTKLQFAICDSVSVYTGESCGTSTREMHFAPCNSTKECNSTNFLYNPTFVDNNSTKTRTCTANPAIGEVRCTARNGDNWLYGLSVNGISSTYARLNEKIYNIKTGEIICENNDRAISYYGNCMDNVKYRKDVMFVGYIYDTRDPSKKSANNYYQLLEKDGVEDYYEG